MADTKQQELKRQQTTLATIAPNGVPVQAALNHLPSIRHVTQAPSIIISADASRSTSPAPTPVAAPGTTAATTSTTATASGEPSASISVPVANTGRRMSMQRTPRSGNLLSPTSATLPAPLPSAAHPAPASNSTTAMTTAAATSTTSGSEQASSPTVSPANSTNSGSTDSTAAAVEGAGAGGAKKSVVGASKWRKLRMLTRSTYSDDMSRSASTTPVSSASVSRAIARRSSTGAAL
jgi:hypothetical protein